jgi:hypothetical protein
VLAVLHEWFLSNHGKYFVFLSSERHISLRKGGVVDNGFLLKAIASYEQQLEPEGNKLYRMRLEVERFGLAWLLLVPRNSKTSSIRVDINHEYLYHYRSMLKEDGWLVL